MKKIISVGISILFIFCLCAAVFASGVTSAPTPVDEASLLFVKKLGTGYRNAPTPLAYDGGFLFVAAGNYLYKLDAHSGETLAKQQMESVSTYTAVPPLVKNGRVYLPLDDGIVQAFSEDDLSPLWTYYDPLGGQGLTPVYYADGCLYTGFWNGETDDANYVCLPEKGSGEQSAIWTFTSKGGFYRAAPLQLGDYLVFGSENGERVNLPDAASNVYVLNRLTGRLVSSVHVPGDIRSGIGYDAASGACFAASKSGTLCRFHVNKNNGEITGFSDTALPGSSTVTPLVYNHRLYTACAYSGKGAFLVMSPDDLSIIYMAELPGMPQGDLLLSNAYESVGEKVLVYSTYNAPPGGVYVFEDCGGQTQAAFTELFAPADEMRQYCFCPITAGDDGALYYKNDSGCIFALSGGADQKNEIVSVYQKMIRYIKMLLALFQLMMGRASV